MASMTFVLLENGLDSALYALERLSDEPDKRDLKHALLFLASAVELVLKEPLRRKDWRLLFENPAKATEKAYTEGEFRSIGLDKAIERLESSCGIKISEAEAKALRVFKDKRNKVEHFSIVDTSEAIISAAVVTLGILLDFVSKHLAVGTLDASDAALLEQVRSKTGEFGAFVEHRMEQISQELQAAYRVTTCPSCLQDALMVGDVIPTCRFCGYTGEAEETAVRFVNNVLGVDEVRHVKDGGESPRRACPECGQRALVLDDRNSGGEDENLEEAKCLACGESWSEGALSNCSDCGELFDSWDGERTRCDDCFQDLVNKDD